MLMAFLVACAYALSSLGLSILIGTCIHFGS